LFGFYTLNKEYARMERADIDNFINISQHKIDVAGALACARNMELS
jgi:hypothetical protein